MTYLFELKAVKHHIKRAKKTKECHISSCLSLNLYSKRRKPSLCLKRVKLIYTFLQILCILSCGLGGGESGGHQVTIRHRTHIIKNHEQYHINTSVCSYFMRIIFLKNIYFCNISLVLFGRIASVTQVYILDVCFR